MKVFPIYYELLKEFEKEGKITDKMRKWAVVNFMECSLNLIGAFEVYILQSNSIFIKRINLNSLTLLKLPSSMTIRKCSFTKLFPPEFKLYSKRCLSITKQVLKFSSNILKNSKALSMFTSFLVILKI